MKEIRLYKDKGVALVDDEDFERVSQLRGDNTSGHRGVTWHKNDKRWQAQINIQGRLLYLGQYKKLQDAIEAQKHAFKQVYEVQL